MIYVTFGRRVAQIASGGTDHDTANNIFLISGGLQQKGMINAMPDLNGGDLEHTVDFKNVYATVLNKWLGADDKKFIGKADGIFVLYLTTLPVRNLFAVLRYSFVTVRNSSGTLLCPFHTANGSPHSFSMPCSVTFCYGAK